MPSLPICKPRYSNQNLRLIEAAGCRDPNRVEALIRQGFDVNDDDLNGVTALIMASCAGQLKAVELLLEAGAKLEHKDSFGYNAYSAAMFYGDFKGVTVKPFDKIMELVKID